MILINARLIHFFLVFDQASVRSSFASLTNFKRVPERSTR